MKFNYCVVKYVQKSKPCKVSKVENIFRWNKKTRRYDIPCSGEWLSDNHQKHHEALRLREIQYDIHVYHHIRVIRLTETKEEALLYIKKDTRIATDVQKKSLERGSRVEKKTFHYTPHTVFSAKKRRLEVPIKPTEIPAKNVKKALSDNLTVVTKKQAIDGIKTLRPHSEKVNEDDDSSTSKDKENPTTSVRRDGGAQTSVIPEQKQKSGSPQTSVDAFRAALKRSKKRFGDRCLMPKKEKEDKRTRSSSPRKLDDYTTQVIKKTCATSIKSLTKYIAKHIAHAPPTDEPGYAFEVRTLPAPDENGKVALGPSQMLFKAERTMFAADCSTMNKRFNTLVVALWSDEERETIVLKKKPGDHDARVVRTCELQGLIDACNALQGMHRIRKQERLSMQLARSWLSRKLKNDRYRYKKAASNEHHNISEDSN